MGRAWVLLVAAGCLQPRYQTCGDAICPIDSVCLANSECVSAEAIAACQGKADGSTCHTPLFDGACTGGACRVPRCGDGIVELPEQCDGSIPAGLDCVDYGFDLGVPKCSPVCTLDVIDSCIRFGWRRVLAVPTSAMWTDGASFYVIPQGSTAIRTYRDGQVAHSYDDGITYATITGKGQTVAAWAIGRMVMSQDGGATFAPIDTTPIPYDLQQVAIADDATPYVLAADSTGCGVYAYHAPSWTQLFSFTGSSPRCLQIAADEGQLVLAQATAPTSGTGHVLRWAGGTSWTPVFDTASPIYDIEIHHGVVYAATLANGVVTSVSGGPTAFASDAVNKIVFVGDDIWLDGSFNAVRYVGGDLEQAAVPIRGTLISAGGRLYVWGDGIYTFSGMEFGDRIAPTGGAVLARLGDATIAYAVGTALLELNTSDGVYYTQIGLPTSFLATAITGPAANDLYVAADGALVHFDGASVANVPLPNGTAGITAAWSPPSGTPRLVLVGSNQLALAGSGPPTALTWTPIAAPPSRTGCTLAAVTGNATRVLAAGDCAGTGIVWELSGSSWREIYRAPASKSALAAIAIDAAGDVLAAGPTGGAREIAAAWTADAALVGSSVDATSLGDIWVGGGPDGIVHFDGTAWSRLQVNGAASPQVVATPRAVYFANVVEAVLLR